MELSAERRMIVERMGAWWRGIHKCGLNCGKVGEEIAETKSGLRVMQVAELVGVAAYGAVKKHQITLIQKSGHTGAQYPHRTHLF